MLKFQIEHLICPACKQAGTARWQLDSAGNDNNAGQSARKLVALTSGFCSIDRGKNAAPEIACMRCEDTHISGKEARSALPLFKLAL